MKKPNDQPAEQQHNEWQFSELLKQVRPDLWVIGDALDLTGVEPFVILKVIRSLNNIANGTKYGTIHIEIINNTVTFIRGEESDRVNLPIYKKDTGIDKLTY